ncbi:matrin-3 [Chanos chanos]|uniref:Matrin-3 n=1 Tax=Chanos chanos TaxID=29144 RepID=A0A6J2UNA5_CHACN|nr:matrin-3-like [Chanos chanos]
MFIPTPNSQNDNGSSRETQMSTRDLKLTCRLHVSAVNKSCKRIEPQLIPTLRWIGDLSRMFTSLSPTSNATGNASSSGNFYIEDWSVHISGAQHANSQLTVLQRYPEWDQQLASARRNEPQAERPREGDRSSRSLPKSSQNKGDPSNTRNRRDTKKETEKKKGSGKVVIVKFAVNSIDETYLKNLLGQFGAIIKVMMLRTLAFVEMGSKDQSEDIVKYFSSNPLKVKGNPVEFSVSSSMNLLQGSRVVSFYPLPSGDGISSEIMAVAKRFGPVKNSFFLPSRGFVEMTASEDAEKLVEHYAVSPLKLQGKTIKIAFSTEYEKLADVKEEDRSSLRSGALPRSSNRRSRSPTKRQQSPRKHSPAPKRRCAETRRSKEKTRSSRSLSSKERDAGHGSRQSSKERPSSSSSSQTESKTAESDKDLEERVATPPNNVADDNKEDEGPEVTDMDSDLEGMEVIADDGVELREEDEPVEGPGTEEQVRESKCGEASNEDELGQKRTVGSSLSDEHETSHSQTEEKPQDSADGLTEGCDKGPSAPAVETKSFAKSAQETENKEREQKGHVQEVDEEESDFLQCLENCITLDELEEVPDSDADSEKRLQRQSSNEQNVKEVKNTNQDHAAGITAEKQSVDKAPTDSKQVKPMKTCHRPEEKEKQSNSTPTSKTEAQDCNTGKESGSNCHTATANGNVKRTLDASDGKPAPKKEPVDSALEPYNPNNPVGREFVRPVVGYFCNLCNVIYASEEEAKEEHCSTLSHYQKLKEHMDKRNGST